MKIIGGLDRAEKLTDHVGSPGGIAACVLSFAANETQFASSFIFFFSSVVFDRHHLSRVADHRPVPRHHHHHRRPLPFPR